jgi:hypothetical protein
VGAGLPIPPPLERPLPVHQLSPFPRLVWSLLLSPGSRRLDPYHVPDQLTSRKTRDFTLAEPSPKSIALHP